MAMQARQVLRAADSAPCCRQLVRSQLVRLYHMPTAHLIYFDAWLHALLLEAFHKRLPSCTNREDGKIVNPTCSNETHTTQAGLGGTIAPPNLLSSGRVSP